MADISKRMNYYDHQFLREADLNLQQDYHMDRHQRHNRLQHTWGVADGLTVEFVSGATLVTVRAGTAVDGEGREIVLALDDARELSGVAADQDVYITITYSEELSDHTAETGAEGMTRWSEVPLIEASASAPANPELSLVLALVARTGTTVTAVDNTVRTLAGVVGGDLEVTSLTFTDPGVIPAQWPSMHLGVAQRADVEGSLRVTQDLIVEGTISGDITAGSVQTADLANGAVTSAKLANDSVTAAKIAANAVGTSELINSAVTNDKVASASINHSRLNLDGGTNPHGTTAANVGALALTGGTVNGNVNVNGQLSSLRTNAGTGVYYGLYSQVAANSTGQARGLYSNTTGSGTGAKYGLMSYASGSGSKFGIYSYVSGTGTKFGGYFYTSTASGDDTQTYGILNNASSAGNGTVYAMQSSASGTGTGIKYGVQATASGAGTKYGGYLSGSSATGITSTTYGLYSRATGDGTGTKYGVSGYASGGGSKYGGYFRSTSPAGVTNVTYGTYSQGTTDATTGSAYGCYGLGYSNTSSSSMFGVRGSASGTGSGAKYAIYGSTGGNGTRYAGYFAGNVHVTGTLSKGSGTFLIDHPLDPYNKTLCHNFVESPENLCLYRGKVKLDAGGSAKVAMPDYFAALTSEDEATVTLTSIGKKPFLAGYEWNNNFTAFTVYGEANGEVSYLVLADRDDPAIHLLRRPVEQSKGGDNFDKGKLLNPEAYNEPPEKGVDPLFEEPVSKEDIKEFKAVEKARQAEEKVQEKLRIAMEKDEQKQQAAAAKGLEKEMHEHDKAASKANKNK